MAIIINVIMCNSNKKGVNREMAERNCANWEKYVWVRM